MTKPTIEEVISETARLAFKEEGVAGFLCWAIVIVISANYGGFYAFCLVTTLILQILLLKAQAGLLKDQLEEKETK